VTQIRKFLVALATAASTAAALGLLPEDVNKWVAVVLAGLGTIGVYAVEERASVMALFNGERRRLYPIVEQPPTTSNGTTNTVTWTVTTYKPNPFHGTSRIMFAVDEWGHRNLGRFHRPFLGWLCDAWERRNGGPT
jgi:hypothetical protein